MNTTRYTQFISLALAGALALSLAPATQADDDDHGHKEHESGKHDHRKHAKRNRAMHQKMRKEKMAARVKDTALGKAVHNSERPKKDRARDKYRHPYQTLAFFGITPDQTVVELWPGGGWYTRILAPYLSRGKLIAAHFDPEANKYYKASRERFTEAMKSDPLLRGAQLATLDYKPRTRLTRPNSADAVLTFRNLHNWEKAGHMELVFKKAFSALKPGGVFGVVEHRAEPGTSREDMAKSGYDTEAYTIELAEKAGFELVARSRVNNNPRDTKNYERGVWTLPPRLALEDKDREKYLAIGESDRMTLKFVKPRR